MRKPSDTPNASNGTDSICRRAVAYEKNGSKAEATQDYDTVLKLNPTIEEASTGFQRYGLLFPMLGLWVTIRWILAGAPAKHGAPLPQKSPEARPDN